MLLEALHVKIQCPGPQRRYNDFTVPINGITYSVLVNTHSKWPLTNTEVTISILDRIFTTHGFPETLVSENGTQFSLAHFEEYRGQWIIDHVFTPLYHFQSEDQIEQLIDTFKRALLKAKEGGAT